MYTRVRTREGTSPPHTHTHGLTMARAAAPRLVAAAVLFLSAPPRHAAADDADGPATVTVQTLLRDFTADHDNFEGALGSGRSNRGALDIDLGADNKPHMSMLPVDTLGGPGTAVQHFTTQADFDQWYATSTPAILMPMVFNKAGDNYVFDSPAYFPLTGKGCGESHDGKNFHFTTEIV